MIRGLYAAASGMVAQMARQDVYAGNLANVNSVGFRRGQVLMGQFASDLAGAQASGGVTAVPAGLDLSQGPLSPTARSLDLALQGDGYFAIQTPSGLAGTRDGRFRLDDQQRLVTAQGYPVLSDSGPLTLVSADFTVTPGGEVQCAGQIAGKLRLIGLNTPRPVGGGLHSGGVTVATGAVVHQGMLEQANVNAVQEMGRMMNGYRLYEANASALRYQDETLGSLMKIVQ